MRKVRSPLLPRDRERGRGGGEVIVVTRLNAANCRLLAYIDLSMTTKMAEDNEEFKVKLNLGLTIKFVTNSRL